MVIVNGHEGGYRRGNSAYRLLERVGRLPRSGLEPVLELEPPRVDPANLTQCPLEF